jgi:hypothetical protein
MGEMIAGLLTAAMEGLSFLYQLIAERKDKRERRD